MMSHAGLIRWLTSAACWALVACAQSPTSAPESSRDYWIALDASISAGEASRARWLDSLGTLVAELRPGDRVAIFALDGATRDAEPVFERRLPALRGAGMDAELRRNGQRRALLEQARAAAEEVLARTAARETDVLGLFDRMSRQGAAQRTITFLSDMSQSSRELDFDRTPLREEQVAPLVAKIVERHAWSPDLLKGTEVRCLLDAPRADQGRDAKAKSGKTSRRVSKRFWQTLVESLGGELAHFDNTQLQPQANGEVR